MTRLVIFRPEARFEFDDAFEWYEKRRPGLGDEFSLCVEATISQIKRNPESGSVVREPLRRVLVRRFPYSVIYLLLDDRIVVFAVFHGSRDPRDWQERLQ